MSIDERVARLEAQVAQLETIVQPDRIKLLMGDNSIILSVETDVPGIWVKSGSQSATMYVADGPVVGVYGGHKGLTPCDAAITADDKHGWIQLVTYSDLSDAEPKIVHVTGDDFPKKA